MKRFECTVIREDKYIIEIDETIINEEFMQEYRESFYDLYTLKDHAKNLAELRARFGDGFSEGYGYVKINGKIPWWVEGKDINRHPEENAINIQIIDEGNDCNVETREL